MEQHKLTISDYFTELGLGRGATVDEIKKAYRKKAREYHPDLNPDPAAKDVFIRATEAYEFLLTYRERISSNQDEFNKAMDDWRKYRQDRSKYRANVYAHTSYYHFKNTNFYKTTRIFDGTTIIFSLAVSIMVLIVTVFGYIYRIHHPLPGYKNPSVQILIIFILFGMTLFVISFIHLKAFIQSSHKHKS